MTSLSSKQKQRVFEAEYISSPKFPRELYLELNNTCNHSCIFCSNEKMTRSNSMMSIDFAKRILVEAFDAGAKDVAFFATGEPFMHKKLPDAIKFAKDITENEIKKENFVYSFLSSIRQKMLTKRK